MTDITIPTLVAEQEESAAFLAANAHAGCFDEMGVGKTLAILKAMKTVGATRSLILCPAIAIAMWPDWAQAYFPDATVQVIRKSKTDPDPDANIIIVNYELFWRKPLWDKLFKLSYDVLALDEAHFLKTPKSRRTKAVYGPRWTGQNGLSSRAERVWLSTGTPCPNNYAELWTHLRALWPDRIHRMGYWDFAKFFCHTRTPPGARQGLQIVGSKNHEAFSALIEDIHIRHLFDNMTGKTVSTYALDADDTLDEYGLPKGHPEYDDVRLVLEKASASSETDEADIDFALHVRNKDHIATMVRLTGLAKAGPAADLLLYELEQTDRKYIVFYYNTEVGDIIQGTLETAGRKVARIGGGMTAKQKEQQIKLLENDPDCQVMVAQIVAAGTAINLQVASEVLLVQYLWTPNDNAQAIARAVRRGQTKHVNVRFLHLNRSIDRHITKVIAGKTYDLGQVFETSE